MSVWDLEMMEDNIDLRMFLKTKEITITEKESKEVFERLEKSKYFVSSVEILTKMPFLELIEVWENNNKRYALWSNRKLETEDVSHSSLSTNDERYNYLDKGHLCYDDLILMWVPDKDEENHIRQCISGLKSLRTEPYIRQKDLKKWSIESEKKEREGKRKEKEIEENQNDAPIVPLSKEKEDGKRFNKAYEKGIFTAENGIKINKNKAHYDGLTIGIGKCPIKLAYGASHYAKKGDISFEKLYDSMIDGLDANLFQPGRWHNHFAMHNHEAKFLSKYLDGVRIHCGAFFIDYRRKTVGKRKKMYIDGILIIKDNFLKALKEAIYHGSKKEYHKFLHEINETPLPAKRLLEKGLTITVNSYSDEKRLYWNVEKRDDKYYVSIDDKKFEVNGGWRKLVSLTHTSRYSERDEWEIYLSLKKIFNKKDIPEIMELGFKQYLEVEKKAKRLLDSTAKEHRKKIRKGRYKSYGKGWFVTGIENKYFINDKCMVYWVKPIPKSGDYLCMHSYGGDNISKYDKILSAMLALLNDKKTKKHIHTLMVRD